MDVVVVMQVLDCMVAHVMLVVEFNIVMLERPVVAILDIIRDAVLQRLIVPITDVEAVMLDIDCIIAHAMLVVGFNMQVLEQRAVPISHPVRDVLRLRLIVPIMDVSRVAVATDCMVAHVINAQEQRTVTQGVLRAQT